MPLVAQLGVVALAALLAGERHLVGIVSVQVILQVVLAVEHFLTVRTLVVFFWRVGSHMPLGHRTHVWVSTYVQM